MKRARVEQRARQSADARAVSVEVLTRLHVLADRLETLGADLRAEVERRKEDEGVTDA